jgi:hypothetical protein
VRPAGVLKSGRDMMCVVGDKAGGVVAGQKKARARTPPRRACAGSARGKDLPRPAEGARSAQAGTPPQPERAPPPRPDRFSLHASSAPHTRLCAAASKLFSLQLQRPLLRCLSSADNAVAQAVRHLTPSEARRSSLGVVCAPPARVALLLSAPRFGRGTRESDCLHCSHAH